jgi:predicted nucleotidyltransferase
MTRRKPHVATAGSSGLAAGGITFEAIPRDFVEQYDGLGRWSVLVGLRGSLAHGLYVSPDEPMGTDDLDVMAVCVPPADHYLGLSAFGSRGTQEIARGEWDIVIYELRKFIGLLVKGNPNVLAMLWLRPEHYLKLTRAGRELITHRALFSTKVAYKSFIGYAQAQLKGLSKSVFRGHMGAKRKELARHLGYDTKHAAHCVRLLRMGCEMMETGELRVDRSRIDRDELLAIKRGEWSLSRVQKEAAAGFEKAGIAYEKSPLPAAPDTATVNALCVSIIRTTWRERGEWARE